MVAAIHCKVVVSGLCRLIIIVIRLLAYPSRVWLRRKEVRPSLAQAIPPPRSRYIMHYGSVYAISLNGSWPCSEMRLCAIILSVSLLLGTCQGQCSRDPLPDSTDCSAAEGACSILYDDLGRPSQLPFPRIK